MVTVALQGDHLVYHQPWNEFLLRFIISQCSSTVTSAVTGLPPLSLSRLRVCDLVSTSVINCIQSCVKKSIRCLNAIGM